MICLLDTKLELRMNVTNNKYTHLISAGVKEIFKFNYITMF